MTLDLDPEGYETQALIRFIEDIEGKNILEVGCGDGRMTWRYAGYADHVTAIDPHSSRIDRAIEDMPAELSEKVVFHPLSLVDYINQAVGPPPGVNFELVLFSWSL